MTTPPIPVNPSRREFLQRTAAVAAAGSAVSLPGGAWAAGSDAPEKKEVRIGFIPLTDCASVVMASVPSAALPNRHAGTAVACDAGTTVAVWPPRIRAKASDSQSSRCLREDCSRGAFFYLSFRE